MKKTLFILIALISILSSCKKHELKKDIIYLLKYQDTTITDVKIITFEETKSLRKQVVKLNDEIINISDSIIYTRDKLSQDSISIMKYANSLDSLIYTYKRKDRPKILRDFKKRKIEWSKTKSSFDTYKHTLYEIIDSLALLKKKLSSYSDKEYNAIIPNDIEEVYKSKIRITKSDTTYTKDIIILIEQKKDYKILKIK